MGVQLPPLAPERTERYFLMKVDIEEVSKTKRIFKIEVPTDVVTKEFDDAYDNLRKRAKIPGFRPGKAPLSIIEKRYGKDVEADLLKKLIPDYYFEAVKDSGVTPLTLPDIGDVDLKKGGPLTFTASVEIKPKIERVNYEGIELKKEEVEVTDKDVDDRIQEFREYNAQLGVAEDDHILVDGDYVQVDYDGFKEGKPVEGLKREGVLFQIGAGAVAPEVDKKLIGARKGEEVEVHLPEPDYILKIKILEVKTKDLPELNDELAKDIGGYNTLAELRDRLRGDILDDKKETLKAAYKKEIVKRLIEMNPVEAPPILVEKEMKRFLTRTKTYMGKKDEFVPEEEQALRKKYMPFAEEEVKGDLLLFAIAENDGIIAAEGEIEEEIKLMARRGNQDVQVVRRSLESMDRGLEGLKTKIIVDKVLKLIMDRAKWT